MSFFRNSDDHPSDASSPPFEAPRRRRRWPWIALVSVLLAPALLLGVWTLITMAYTYSEGERAGYVQKFSKKGWLCKTWEGEIAMVTVPGTLQDRFAFTVRNDSIAAEINRLQGARVALHYEEHRGVPLSCLGETGHFVDGVRTLDPVGAPGAPGGPGAPDAAPTPGAATPPTAPPAAPTTAPRRDTIDPSAATR